MKRCNVFFVDKPLTEFYTNGKQPNGKQKYKPLCIPCEEVNKCILVCSNCHREIHAGMYKV